MNIIIIYLHSKKLPADHSHDLSGSFLLLLLVVLFLFFMTCGIRRSALYTSYTAKRSELQSSMMPSHMKTLFSSHLQRLSPALKQTEPL